MDGLRYGGSLYGMGWTKRNQSLGGTTARRRRRKKIEGNEKSCRYRCMYLPRPRQVCTYIHTTFLSLVDGPSPWISSSQGWAHGHTHAGLLMIAAICRRLTPPPPPNRPGVHLFFSFSFPRPAEPENHRTEILPCTLSSLLAAGAANWLICKGIACRSRPTTPPRPVFYTHLPTPFFAGWPVGSATSYSLAILLLTNYSCLISSSFGVLSSGLLLLLLQLLLATYIPYLQYHPYNDGCYRYRYRYRCLSLSRLPLSLAAASPHHRSAILPTHPIHCSTWEATLFLFPRLLIFRVGVVRKAFVPLASLIFRSPSHPPAGPSKEKARRTARPWPRRFFCIRLCPVLNSATSLSRQFISRVTQVSPPPTP